MSELEFTMDLKRRGGNEKEGESKGLKLEEIGRLKEIHELGFDLFIYLPYGVYFLFFFTR